MSEEFEAWAASKGLPVERLVNNERYCSMETEYAFQAWHAGGARTLYEFTHGSYVMPAGLNLAMCERAKELNLQSSGCPGPGKCNDPGCPAHYAREGER